MSLQNLFLLRHKKYACSKYLQLDGVLKFFSNGFHSQKKNLILFYNDSEIHKSDSKFWWKPSFKLCELQNPFLIRHLWCGTYKFFLVNVKHAYVWPHLSKYTLLRYPFVFFPHCLHSILGLRRENSNDMPSELSMIHHQVVIEMVWVVLIRFYPPDHPIWAFYISLLWIEKRGCLSPERKL